MKVLVVEDNFAMRAMITSLAETVADTVIQCGGGIEAVALYQSHLPDWVLMDIAMNHGGGLEATTQIMRSWPRARILIVSSYNDKALREAARAAGALGYIVKEELSMICDWLQGREIDQRIA